MSSTDRNRPYYYAVETKRRQYTFEVQQNVKGTDYLIIRESWKVDDKTKKRFIKVYKDGLVAFHKALTRANAHLGTSIPAFIINARKKHARAYMPWTAKDDKKLRSQYEKGVDIQDLARMFERKGSAITSRLAKLGLIEAP